MNDNKAYKRIDEVLKYICNANQPPFRTDGEISKDLNFDQNFKELSEILFKLERENFIRSEIDNTNIKRYYSTFDGQIFKTQNGFTGKSKKEKRGKIFTCVQTILTVLNIIAILILGFMNYMATKKANDNKDEIKNYKLNIDKKNKTIDSLIYFVKKLK